MKKPLHERLHRVSLRGALRTFVLTELLLIASDALARVGGGGSYSGGSSGSGDGGGGLIYFAFRILLWLTIEHPVIGIPIDIVVIILVVRHFRKSPGSGDAQPVLQLGGTAAPSRPVVALRRFDPNFSEITLTDFCYSLYARAHRARGERKLDQYSPYISPEARAALIARNPADLRDVRDVIVGSLQIEGVQGLDSAIVQIPVTYESNLTEVTGSGQQGWYLREQWI